MCALNNALRIRKWIKGFGRLDSTSLLSSSLLSPPSPSLSITWYNRNSHHNTKEEEDNNSNNQLILERLIRAMPQLTERNQLM